MPIHNWTRVETGIFHAFHHGWIEDISRALNRGILPREYYALPEQIAGGLGPDVLTLQRPSNGIPFLDEPAGGVVLATTPPRVQLRLRSEPDRYATKAKAAVIRHTTDHRVIAIVEIVSPGNKNTRSGLRSFVAKVVEMLGNGVHLLIADLLPPGPRDPQGIHKAVWDEIIDNDFVLPAGRPLTLAAYSAGTYPEAFLEFTAVQSPLSEMPLFLSEGVYVLVPLEATYQSAFEGLPAFWRDVLSQVP
jgi:hypothetical protein